METARRNFSMSRWINGAVARRETSWKVSSTHTLELQSYYVASESESEADSDFDDQQLQDLETEWAPIEDASTTIRSEDCNVCYICSAPNPDYMSTDAVPRAPPVPVCSVACESAYLGRKGYHPVKPSASGSKNKPSCCMCSKPGAKYTAMDDEGNKLKGIFVCGDDCEEEYLNKEVRKTNGQSRMQGGKLRKQLSAVEMHLITGGKRRWWTGALAFYEFVYQRQSMWQCYAMGDNDPKVDPALIKYWFGNVYRELDRSTAYLRKTFVKYKERYGRSMSLKEALWTAVVFRFCNKIETFEKVAIPSSDKFHLFQKRLQHIAEKPSSNDLFSDASERELTVTSYLEVLQRFHFNLAHYAAKLAEAEDTSEAFSLLQQLPSADAAGGTVSSGLGSFTCWQVVCDLVELHVLDIETENFVYLTKEARTSLIRIFGPKRAFPQEFVKLAHVLQKRQEQGFAHLHVEFPKLLGASLNLKNIAHALHLFHHFYEIKKVERKRQQSAKFAAKDKKGMDDTRPAYVSRSFMQDDEGCEVCTSAEQEDKMVLCDLCYRGFHFWCANLSGLPPASWICSTCLKMETEEKEEMEDVDMEGDDVIVVE